MSLIKTKRWPLGGFYDSDDRDIFDRLYDIFEIGKGHFQVLDETDITKNKLRTKYEGVSLRETAEFFGVTQERMRQIEARALRKLRHPSRSLLLKEFLYD